MTRKHNHPAGLSWGRYCRLNDYDPAGWWDQTPAGKDIGGGNVVTIPINPLYGLPELYNHLPLCKGLDENKFNRVVFVNGEVYAINNDASETLTMKIPRRTHEKCLLKAFSGEW